ncbi:MAG: FtsX-like permease family protein [Nitrospiraceae bacterium]
MLRALGLISQSHLLQQPVRTAITILGVALGVSVSVAIRTANVDVLASFKESVITVAGRATLQVSGGELGLDETVIADLIRHPGVVSATPVLHQGAMVARGPHRGTSLMVLALDLLEAADLKAFRIQTGDDALGSLDRLLAPNAIFVGVRLANELGLSEGSTLEILVGTTVHEVVVQGLIESSSGVRSLWETMAVMDIAAAQALFGLVGRLDRIDVLTDPDRPVAAVAQELQQMVPPPLKVRRPTQRNEQVERMVKAFQLNLTTLSAVALLVGLLLVYNTVSYAVVQRRREIGMYRALGMSRGAVSTLFMGEAAVMGLVGGVVGSGFGVLLAQSLVSLISQSVTDLYVAVTPTGSEVIEIPWGMIRDGVLLGIIVSLLGGAAPSVVASRTIPARALGPGEYEASQTLNAGRFARVAIGMCLIAGIFAVPGPVDGIPLFGYASALCLLLGLSFLGPLVVRGVGVAVHGTDRIPKPRGLNTLSRLAADQVARAPGRNAVTMCALMVGVAIMVGVGTMIHSFRQTVEVWINQTIMADLVVAPVSWPVGGEDGMLAERIPLEWVSTVASVPGVAAVDTYRVLTIEIDEQPVSLVSRDLLVHAEWSRYLFRSGKSADTLRQTVAAHGVIVSEVLATKVEVDIGESLVLLTPSGERSFPVVGVFYDYATDGGKVVMDRALYQTYWDDDTTTVVPVYLNPNAKLETVRQQIGESVRQHGQVVVVSNADIKTEVLAIFDRTFTITYALEFIAVAVALLGIFNTILTSVLERQRELATLRAIGGSAQQIRRLVLWESAYLGGLGAVMGIIGGSLLSILLVEVINKQSFGWSIQFAVPLGLFVEAVFLSLVTAVAAGYLPARWAAQQTTAQGLRYE